MNIKWLIAASSFAFSVSAGWAADMVTYRAPVASVVTTPVVVAPTFSWTGSYIGGEIGNFSGDTNVEFTRKEQKIPINENTMPHLSGSVGGFYAGSNIEFGKGIVIGFDTDIVFIGKKNTQNVKGRAIKKSRVDEITETLKKAGIHIKTDQGKEIKIQEGDKRLDSYTFKQKWAGALRARMGFVAGRVLPYIAGGVAYSQFQSTASIEILQQNTADRLAFGHLADEKKSFVGYTVGGGVDLAMTDNIIMRAEYRYSDYGKKKLARDKYDISYKTNDFRVGIAYKF
ncbi:outer membrane protein [Bartonella sp. B30(2025)]